MTNENTIVILPYDPFYSNRMVYTIQNHCVEDASVPYDDGAKKIFLYTKGTEGNPSQRLRDMLKYIEESVDTNITNPDIEKIENYVKKVKSDKEVGINYMKSWEREQMIKEEATKEGRAEGKREAIIKFSSKLSEKEIAEIMNMDISEITEIINNQ